MALEGLTRAEACGPGRGTHCRTGSSAEVRSWRKAVAGAPRPHLLRHLALRALTGPQGFSRTTSQVPADRVQRKRSCSRWAPSAQNSISTGVIR